jgi:hypothetical protein
MLARSNRGCLAVRMAGCVGGGWQSASADEVVLHRQRSLRRPQMMDVPCFQRALRSGSLPVSGRWPVREDQRSFW